MNITMTEWKAREAEIALEVTRRWPWLMKPYKDDSAVRIAADALTATLELEFAERDHFLPRVVIGSSRTCSGTIADVCEFARQVAEVRDAMLLVHGLVSGVVVWPDGECPCSHCGGRGTSQGAPCKRCEGKGKR